MEISKFHPKKIFRLGNFKVGLIWIYHNAIKIAGVILLIIIMDFFWSEYVRPFYRVHVGNPIQTSNTEQEKIKAQKYALDKLTPDNPNNKERVNSFSVIYKGTNGKIYRARINPQTGASEKIEEIFSNQKAKAPKYSNGNIYYVIKKYDSPQEFGREREFKFVRYNISSSESEDLATFQGALYATDYLIDQNSQNIVFLRNISQDTNKPELILQKYNIYSQESQEKAYELSGFKDNYSIFWKLSSDEKKLAIYDVLPDKKIINLINLDSLKTYKTIESADSLSRYYNMDLLSPDFSKYAVTRPHPDRPSDSYQIVVYSVDGNQEIGKNVFENKEAVFVWDSGSKMIAYYTANPEFRPTELPYQSHYGPTLVWLVNGQKMIKYPNNLNLGLPNIDNPIEWIGDNYVLLSRYTDFSRLSSDYYIFDVYEGKFTKISLGNFRPTNPSYRNFYISTD